MNTIFDLANGFGYWVYHHYPSETEKDNKRLLYKKGEEFDIKEIGLSQFYQGPIKLDLSDKLDNKPRLK